MLPTYLTYLISKQQSNTILVSIFNTTPVRWAFSSSGTPGNSLTKQDYDGVFTFDFTRADGLVSIHTGQCHIYNTYTCTLVADVAVYSIFARVECTYLALRSTRFGILCHTFFMCKKDKDGVV